MCPGRSTVGVDPLLKAVEITERAGNIRVTVVLSQPRD